MSVSNYVFHVKRAARPTVLKRVAARPQDPLHRAMPLGCRPPSARTARRPARARGSGTDIPVADPRCSRLLFHPAHAIWSFLLAAPRDRSRRQWVRMDRDVGSTVDRGGKHPLSGHSEPGQGDRQRTEAGPTRRCGVAQEYISSRSNCSDRMTFHESRPLSGLTADGKAVDPDPSSWNANHRGSR
jgi:hypothetical protein